MPQIHNTHAEAADGAELRRFGYAKHATVAAMNLVTGRPGEICTVTATGVNYKWNAVRSEWWRWERGYQEIDAAGSTPALVLETPTFELDRVRVTNIAGSSLALTYIALFDGDGALQWVNEQTGHPLSISTLPVVLRSASFVLRAASVIGSTWIPEIDTAGLGSLTLPAGATATATEITFPNAHTGIDLPATFGPTTAPWSLGMVASSPASASAYLFADKDVAANDGTQLRIVSPNVTSRIDDTTGGAAVPANVAWPASTMVFVYLTSDGTAVRMGVDGSSTSAAVALANVDNGVGGRIFARLNGSNHVADGVLKAFMFDNTKAWTPAEVATISAALV